MADDGVQVVQGKDVAILFEGKRCIHSRGCVLGRPDVFVPNVEGQWIHPDAARVEEIAELAHACPSGAIRYRRRGPGLDGGPEEAAPRVNVVRVRENGPLAIHAEIALAGHTPGPDEPATLRMTLCRCGDSKNKPFCDNSHKAAGFNATGEPSGSGGSSGSGAITVLPARDGRLEIRPGRNGPLLLSGNVEICTGTGRTIAKVTKTALCRCGQSSNKPFCDGTHNKVGFIAD